MPSVKIRSDTADTRGTRVFVLLNGGVPTTGVKNTNSTYRTASQLRRIMINVFRETQQLSRGL